MKKIMIALGVLGFSQYATAQQNVVTKYPEEMHLYSDNIDLMGSARYRGLSGAMGALGGDMSASAINPAGLGIFLRNEISFTGGVNSSKIKNSTSESYKNSETNLDQAGAVLVFDELNSTDWRSVGIGINYQKTNFVNDDYEVALNTKSVDNPNLAATKYSSNEKGSTSVTNLNVGANYKDKVYFGLGLNVHRFEIDRAGDHLYETDLGNNEILDYYKDQSKWYRDGTGASVTVGIIGRVNKELRLGLAYQSPTWYKDVQEGLVYFNNNKKDYYWDYAVNDKTTSQKVTASGAYVFGKHGFISADYTYTDYSPAKFATEDSFRAENNFINNSFKSTNAVRVGGEAKIDNFKLRAGYRYEQSPFEEVEINGFKYLPYGDVNGFSIGAGYDFAGFYVDAAYNMSKRDRSTLVSGNFYNYSQANQAFYTVNATDSGYEQVVNNITENKGSFALTLGFRF